MLDTTPMREFIDLSFGAEMQQLREEIALWIKRSDVEMQETLEWQFVANSKYFRPLTVFSSYRAMQGGEIPPSIIRGALLIELFHNVSLVIDDIVDHSEYRRDKATLYKKFGELQALMASGYIVADAYCMAAEDIGAITLLSELMKRLAVAECMQWRLRRQPSGVEDWRKLAGEDTGSMFEVAACLGDRSERLRKFGGLLGLLYHGCDDVADVRGSTALGGGGFDDLRDGILTLPAALAIRNPKVANMFCTPSEDNLTSLASAFQASLPEAERYLDGISEEAKTEARLFANKPELLLALVEQTRRLSQRQIRLTLKHDLELVHVRSANLAGKSYFAVLWACQRNPKSSSGRISQRRY